MKCNQCGKEFASKRSTAKYCGSVCRKLAFQEVKRNAKPGTVIPIEIGTLTDPELEASQGMADMGFHKVKQGNKAKSADPQVQAIWDKRNAQGQPSTYTKRLTPTEPQTPALPGDSDYVGCCIKVDGIWKTKEARAV